jgi:hypothetical protein
MFKDDNLATNIGNMTLYYLYFMQRSSSDCTTGCIAFIFHPHIIQNSFLLQWKTNIQWHVRKHCLVGGIIFQDRFHFNYRANQKLISWFNFITFLFLLQLYFHGSRESLKDCVIWQVHLFQFSLLPGTRRRHSHLHTHLVRALGADFMY